MIYFVEKKIENSDYVYTASHKLLSMARIKVQYNFILLTGLAGQLMFVSVLHYLL